MGLKVLVTGQGATGSWAIRGEQLGQAIGATVQPQARSARGFDIVVVVKRLHSLAILRSARWHGIPVIWDIVDAWPQGRHVGKVRTCEAAMSWLRQSLRMIKPDGVIAPTRQMEKDLQFVQESGIQVTTLAHHAWQGKPINPIRHVVRTIGYQGGEKHLGNWAADLSREARLRGWQFVVNPESLADVDIAVALRGESGYASKNWKSNVKLANAQASGTPIILAREAGYLETASGSEFWADTAAELSAGLDWFAEHAHRAQASAQMRGTEPQLTDIAANYKGWLTGICRRPALAGRRETSPTRKFYDLAYSFVTDPFHR